MDKIKSEESSDLGAIHLHGEFTKTTAYSEYAVVFFYLLFRLIAFTKAMMTPIAVRITMVIS